MVVIHGKPTMRQAQHPAAVGTHAGQQSRTTGRTRGGGRECLAKKDALLRYTVEVGGGNVVSIGLNVAARIMRMEIQNVRAVGRGAVPQRKGAPGEGFREGRAARAGHTRLDEFPAPQGKIFDSGPAGPEQISSHGLPR